MRLADWLVLAVLLFALAACGGEESATPTPPSLAAVTVETGGMALPGARAADSAASANAAAPAPVAPNQPVFAPGAQVALSAPAAVYAEPDRTALRFAEYAAGSLFTVVEPDGDQTGYPVEAGGKRWYRVRAEDKLVGWMMADALAAE